MFRSQNDNKNLKSRITRAWGGRADRWRGVWTRLPAAPRRYKPSACFDSCPVRARERVASPSVASVRHRTEICRPPSLPLPVRRRHLRHWRHDRRLVPPHGAGMQAGRSAPATRFSRKGGRDDRGRKFACVAPMLSISRSLPPEWGFASPEVPNVPIARSLSTITSSPRGP